MNIHKKTITALRHSISPSLLAAVLFLFSAFVLSSCSLLETPEKGPNAALDKEAIKTLNAVRAEARSAVENLSSARGNLNPANPNNPLDNLGQQHNEIINAMSADWGSIQVPCLDCNTPSWMMTCTKYYDNCMDDLGTEAAILAFVQNATNNPGFPAQALTALRHGGSSIFKATGTLAQTLAELHQGGDISTFDYNLMIIIVDDVADAYVRNGVSGVVATVQTFEDAITVRGLEVDNADLLLGSFAIMKYSSVLWTEQIASLPPGDQAAGEAYMFEVVSDDIRGFLDAWVSSSGNYLEDALNGAVIASQAAGINREIVVLRNR